MSKTIEEILSPKPEARPHLYACSIADQALAGLRKVGQTTRDVYADVASAILADVEPWLPARRIGLATNRHWQIPCVSICKALSGRQDAARYGRQGCLPPLFQAGGKG
jgi:hypothetical protein